MRALGLLLVLLPVLVLLPSAAAVTVRPPDINDLPDESVRTPCADVAERTYHSPPKDPRDPKDPQGQEQRWKVVTANASFTACVRYACSLAYGAMPDGMSLSEDPCCPKGANGTACERVEEALAATGRKQLGTAIPVVGGGVCVTYSPDNMTRTTVELRDCLAPPEGGGDPGNGVQVKDADGRSILAAKTSAFWSLVSTHTSVALPREDPMSR